MTVPIPHASANVDRLFGAPGDSLAEPALLQFPDAQRREEKTFRAREGADGGPFFFRRQIGQTCDALLAWASAGPALGERAGGGSAPWEMAAAVHNFHKAVPGPASVGGGMPALPGNRLCASRFSGQLSPVMANRKLGCLSIFLFVALCASLFFNVILAFTALSRLGGAAQMQEARLRFRETVIDRAHRASNDKIAIITLRGLISSSLPGNVGDSMVDDMRYALEQAREDNNVRAIVLEIDSPGGEVTASDVIYDAVVRTRAVKPVIVYMDSVAASGGYYVACGGKYIMANETTITGSIGVIIQTLNYEQLLNKVGLASVVFKSGKFKDMLNGARPISPEERAYVQGFVMSTYEKFLGIVAKERNLPADGLRTTIADGRILSGRDAHENKLIDGLGQIEDAFRKAKELSGAPDAAIVKYGPPFNISRIFRALGQGGPSKIEVSLPKQLVPQLESGRAYFLPSYYAP